MVPARAGHGGRPVGRDHGDGARAPNSARSEAYRSTSTSPVAKWVPASSIWKESLPRQASTMDGAARAATSSTVPGPVTSETAAPTAALANCTTTRISGRSSLIRRAVSRVWTSVRSAQTTARAWASPACSRTAGEPGAAHDVGDVPGLDHPDQALLRLVVHHHHGHPGLVELFDHPQADALEAAHDDVALPVLDPGLLHPDMVPHLHFLRIAAVFPAGTGAGPADRLLQAEREYTFALSVVPRNVLDDVRRNDGQIAARICPCCP